LPELDSGLSEDGGAESIGIDLFSSFAPIGGRKPRRMEILSQKQSDMAESNNVDSEKLSAHLIEKYRQLIAERYQYARLKEAFELSPELSEEVVSEVRRYFLERIYPTADEREQLNDAFETLSSYVSSPAKAFGLLGNMASAVFKFGTLLPSAMKAGIASLESFIVARRFEERLLDAAMDKDYQPPLTDEAFFACVRQIPRVQAEQFVGSVYALFNSMTNTRLLGKTIAILESVVAKMKSRPAVYPEKDVEGILLGLAILRHGYAIFKDLDETLKKEITDTINISELRFLEYVYNE
jgi:hypothetical protein